MTSEGSAWDVYREIHNAMRFALFEVTARAGVALARPTKQAPTGLVARIV